MLSVWQRHPCPLPNVSQGSITGRVGRGSLGTQHEEGQKPSGGSLRRLTRRGAPRDPPTNAPRCRALLLLREGGDADDEVLAFVPLLNAQLVRQFLQRA